MNLREKLNTQEGYEEIIDEDTEYIDDKIEKIKELKHDELNRIQKYPKTNNDIIKSYRNGLVMRFFNLIIAEYSIGKEYAEIKKTFIKLLNTMETSWNTLSLENFKHGFNEPPYYTTDNYQQILTLISFGILLEVDDDNFSKIVKIRDKVNTPDKLLDFMINYRVRKEQSKNQLPYNYYTNLLKILDKNEKNEIIKSLKNYLSKQWFKEFGKMADADTHKGIVNYHTGYWSWEAGAIAKILDLDDSSLKDQQYYPYDMVHFKD